MESASTSTDITSLGNRNAECSRASHYLHIPTPTIMIGDATPTRGHSECRWGDDGAAALRGAGKERQAAQRRERERERDRPLHMQCMLVLSFLSSINHLLSPPPEPGRGGKGGRARVGWVSGFPPRGTMGSRLDIGG